MSNANVPQTLFHIFFLPSICQPNSTQLNSAQLSSCNSAQLSSANYLVAQLSSANYLVAQVGSARPTHKTITTYSPNKSGRGGREIFLVVAGSRLVVLDGCCALRASLSGSTQRGTAPRPFAPTFPATLRRPGGDLSPTRRRPFAVNVRILFN